MNYEEFRKKIGERGAEYIASRMNDIYKTETEEQLLEILVEIYLEGVNNLMDILIEEHQKINNNLNENLFF